MHFNNFSKKAVKTISTILAVTLSTVLVPVLLDQGDVRAAFQKNKDNTCLGVSKIEKPIVPDSVESNWQGSYVYWGSYDNAPIRFRVLDPDSNKFGSSTLFLDSDITLYKRSYFDTVPNGITIVGLIENGQFYVDQTVLSPDDYMALSDQYVWENSDIKNGLNGSEFYDKEGVFTEAEKKAIASSYSAPDSTVDPHLEYEIVNHVGLNGEKVFLLDAADLYNTEYGYIGADKPLHEDYNHEKNYPYWLRNRYNTIFGACDVYRTGFIYFDPVFCEVIGVAPALNIDQSKILFSTSINGSFGYKDAEYKLTIIDDEIDFGLSSTPTLSGETLSIPYSITGSDSDNVSHISMLITDKEYSDKNADILYYDMLESTSNTAEFTLPAGLTGTMGVDYYLYIIAEDVNDEYETDYASLPVEITSVTSPDNANNNVNPAPANSTPTTPSVINPAPASTAEEPESDEKGFEAFVERLYEVALGRASESEGKTFWCEHVKNGDLTGADCAREFLTSKEFKDRNLSDEDFLKVLYSTFFNRNVEDDVDGFNFWLNSLKSEGRDNVVDGFINSTEWCNVCASYGVRSGAPTAKATVASENAKTFAERLYTKCLGREAEQEGLSYWSLSLTNQEITGTKAAKEFFYSKEFLDANYSNEEYLNRLYATFMGREPDANGFAYWLGILNNGTSRDDVFDSFSTSPEFKAICSEYAILA